MIKVPRVAIVDIGSNSIKLLVAQAGRPLSPVVSATKDTRLSKGIGLAGGLTLSKEAISLGVANICSLVEQAQKHQPDEILLVATSAIRDSENRDVFKQAVEAKTGLPLRILTGEEEAHGIAFGLESDPHLRHHAHFIAADLGGGSLECIRCDDHVVSQAISFPLGSVRVSERFIEDTKVSLPKNTQDDIYAYVQEVLKNSDFRWQPVTGPVVGTSGACSVSRSILAHRMGRTFYQTPVTLSIYFLKALLGEIAPLNHDQRLKIPALPPSRADIFPTALITVIAMLDLMGATQIIHSSRNLRFGLAAQWLKERSSKT
jgi:exopolyphosphatase / guanosine-5'-triphosphate,3'-diphosphate pyrophosphatase